MASNLENAIRLPGKDSSPRMIHSRKCKNYISFVFDSKKCVMFVKLNFFHYSLEKAAIHCIFQICNAFVVTYHFRSELLNFLWAWCTARSWWWWWSGSCYADSPPGWCKTRCSSGWSWHRRPRSRHQPWKPVLKCFHSVSTIFIQFQSCK